MNKTKISDARVRSELREKDGIEYRYDLIMRKSSRVASYQIPLYSVSVEMKKADGEVSNATTRDIFSDVGKALVFFERLVSSLASPTELRYIVEDELKK